MATVEPWYIGERAEALATMYLTRRQDLEVSSVSPRSRYTGSDIQIRLKSKSGGAPITFIVKVKGVFRSSPRLGLPSSRMFPVRYAVQELEDRGLPVCIFLFTVDDERGYYRWLYEPVVSDQQQAVLRLEQNFASISPEDQERQQVVILSKFEELNDEAIAKVVHQVMQWYRAARPVLAVYSV